MTPTIDTDTGEKYRALIISDNPNLTRARFPSSAEIDEYEKGVTDERVEYYDAVCIDHVLQQVSRTEAKELVLKLRKMLKREGEFIVVVPSLDWACSEIAKNDPVSLMAYVTLYGSDIAPHKCGFTLQWLRTLIDTSGFLVIAAYLEKYSSVVQGDQEEEALQNVVIALRSEEAADDPSRAIG